MCQHRISFPCIRVSWLRGCIMNYPGYLLAWTGSQLCSDTMAGAEDWVCSAELRHCDSWAL